MALKGTIKAIPMDSLNAVALNLVAFTPYLLPLPNACFMIRFLNRSNRIVAVSYDGINTHDAVPADSEYTINFQQFHQPNGEVVWLKQGTQVYLMGNPVGANGVILLCGYYQESQ